MAASRRTRSPCCARAVSGNAAAAPPTSVMNSRLLTRSPRRRTPAWLPSSLLWLNMRRGVVMSDLPFAATFNDKHREARWCGYGFALPHPGKLVKAGNHDSVVAQHDGAPLPDRVLIAAAL